ncbi:hypothetical protein [Adhaeribacter aquaticus]|nr:hypothetical protein [Adhaeribacter aquaticus]
MNHKDLKEMWWFWLMIQDAQNLFAKYNFNQLKHPEQGMQITKPGLYQVW